MFKIFDCVVLASNNTERNEINPKLSIFECVMW